jgi:hypothetical protein
MSINKSQAFFASSKPPLSPHLPHQNCPEAILMVGLAEEVFFYFFLNHGLVKQALFSQMFGRNIIQKQLFKIIGKPTINGNAKVHLWLLK